VTDTIEQTVTDRRAFAVRFSDLERWSVGSFTSIEWVWPASGVRPLGTVLYRKTVSVEDASDGQLITIRFSGEIEPRKGLDASSIKGRLFWAEPGDLVYSKIDLRHGAIGVLPAAIGRACVTSEYPVYEVRTELADPAYVALAVRSRVFRSKVNSLISGASGRKRVQPEELEQVTIPVPPLDAQRAIIAVWINAQAEAEAIRQRASNAEWHAETDFIHALGLTRPKRVERSRAFAVNWSEMERWNVLYNQLAGTNTDLSKGTYAVCTLGDHLALAQYGTSKKANSWDQGVPVLRINNIKDGRLDTSDLKHVTLSAAELHSLTLQKGDILVIRTSGSRDLVGTCAVFDEDDTYVHASYLIRLRVDQTCVDPRFAAYFLNSILGRQQVNALSRHIMMNNINSEELRSLLLPLPPLSIQSKLISAVEAQRERAQALRAQADRRLASASAAVEAMILGTKPIPIA
jgi:type I restriction enzyme, S subunit